MDCWCTSACTTNTRAVRSALHAYEGLQACSRWHVWALRRHASRLPAYSHSTLNLLPLNCCAHLSSTLAQQMHSTVICSCHAGEGASEFEFTRHKSHLEYNPTVHDEVGVSVYKPLAAAACPQVAA